MRLDDDRRAPRAAAHGRRSQRARRRVPARGTRRGDSYLTVDARSRSADCVNTGVASVRRRAKVPSAIRTMKSRGGARGPPTGMRTMTARCADHRRRTGPDGDLGGEASAHDTRECHETAVNRATGHDRDAARAGVRHGALGRGAARRHPGRERAQVDYPARRPRRHAPRMAAPRSSAATSRSEQRGVDGHRGRLRMPIRASARVPRPDDQAAAPGARRRGPARTSSGRAHGPNDGPKDSGGLPNDTDTSPNSAFRPPRDDGHARALQRPRRAGPGRQPLHGAPPGEVDDDLNSGSPARRSSTMSPQATPTTAWRHLCGES